MELSLQKVPRGKREKKERGKKKENTLPSTSSKKTIHFLLFTFGGCGAGAGFATTTPVDWGGAGLRGGGGGATEEELVVGCGETELRLRADWKTGSGDDDVITEVPTGSLRRTEDEEQVVSEYLR